VDGEELHRQFSAAARDGGGWVDVAWKNKPEDPTFYQVPAGEGEGVLESNLFHRFQ